MLYDDPIIIDELKVCSLQQPYFRHSNDPMSTRNLFFSLEKSMGRKLVMLFLEDLSFDMVFNDDVILNVNLNLIEISRMDYFL